MISLIAAVDEANGLGKNNQLLCHLPADLQHFKQLTLGKPIIMGLNTFNSIGKPLPGRENIVLSQSVSTIDGAKVFTSLESALQFVQNALEIMIIGGASIYRQAIEIANTIYLTKIHHTFAADVFFPEIDETQWRCSERKFQSKDPKNPYDITFVTYQK